MFKSKVIKIGNIEIDCYRDSENGDYYLSQRQVTKIIQVDEVTVRLNRMSKQLKSLLGGDYSVRSKTIDLPQGGRTTAYLIDIDKVPTIWYYFAKKGNEIAETLMLALTAESLKIRADFAFNIDKSRGEYNKEVTPKLRLKIARARARKSHNYFQPYCEKQGFVARHVHDYVTQLIVNRTATESITQLPLNMDIKEEPEENIGLDHWEDFEGEEMNILAKFKELFPCKRPHKGEDYKSFTERVLTQVLDEIEEGV